MDYEIAEVPSKYLISAEEDNYRIIVEELDDLIDKVIVWQKAFPSRDIVKDFNKNITSFIGSACRYKIYLEGFVKPEICAQKD